MTYHGRKHFSVYYPLLGFLLKFKNRDNILPNALSSASLYEVGMIPDAKIPVLGFNSLGAPV